ncbi:MAG: ISAs1 family transposase, partial [Nocardioidaceae bacterium]
MAAIGDWAADLARDDLDRLGVAAAPDESTLRKLFARVDAEALDQQVGAFVWTRTREAGARRVIALDGKTVRGARSRGEESSAAPHLVAAFDHVGGTVLGQVAVADKSNEIPAVQDLLSRFDLKDALVTVDAMHTQADTAQTITNAGGDYVFTVK